MYQLAHPIFLISLPAPLLIYYLVKPAVMQTHSALRVPFFTGLQRALPTVSHNLLQSRWRQWLAGLIWLLLIIASCDPQWIGDPLPQARNGRDIMMAVDISGSMHTPDLSVNGQALTRLTVVKAVAKQFIAQRSNDKLGLILFGTRAYLQTPLTFDHKTLTSMLDDASVGLAGPQTAIGDAIGLAIKRLLQTPSQQHVLILLTDGASNAGNVLPVDAAAQAAKAGIKIYTVGLGAGEMAVSGLFGMQTVNPSADLDEKTLQTIAQTTGGLYFRAKDVAGLAAAYHAIDKLEPTLGASEVIRPVQSLYPWPLTLALLCSLVLAIVHGQMLTTLSRRV